MDPTLAQLRLARDPLGRMTELFDRYGAPVALIRGGGGRVFSGDPNCPGVVFVRGRELTREVALDPDRFHRSGLTGQLTPPIDAPERFRPILEWGTGLFAVNGEDHRRHRRLLAPFFTRPRLDNYLDEMQRATTEMLNRWQIGRRLDMHREMMDLTVQISARTLLGLDMHSNQPLFRAGADSLRLVLSPWVLLAPLDKPGLPYRRFLRAVSDFNAGIRQIVHDRRRHSANQSRDLLSHLIRAHDERGMLSDSEVIGHASVMYAASHETTGNALTWALFLLSQYPEWQKRASEEARSLSAIESSADLDGLETLDWVIRETLRLIPSAPWTTRIAARDSSFGGHPLPKGTEIVLSIFHTHRVERIYEQPNRFDPSRWQHIRPDVFEFNAFGAGTRACIGMGFAMLEMKLILAMILRRLRVELDASRSVDPVLNITMAPRCGLQMFVRDGIASSGPSGAVRGGIRRLIDLS